MNKNKFIRILGIGSPFGDDQLGWKAIDLLSDRQELQKIYLEKCDRPGVSLLSLMKNADTVFLIDAIRSNDAVGKIHRWQDVEIETKYHPTSSHAMGIAEALQLAKALQEIPKSVILFGIEMDENNYASSLSLPVQKSLFILVERIVSELLSH